jgi:hypothetical protein
MGIRRNSECRLCLIASQQEFLMERCSIKRLVVDMVSGPLNLNVCSCVLDRAQSVCSLEQCVTFLIDSFSLCSVCACVRACVCVCVCEEEEEEDSHCLATAR